MKKAIALLAALSALAFALPAGAKPENKPAWAGPGLETTIVGTAIELSGGVAFDNDPNDFDILVAAVVATGINESILDGSDDYTVFAPTDQAFLDVASAIAQTTVTDEAAAFGIIATELGVDGVADVLAYHVVEGSRPSPSVVNPPDVKMLDGNTISLDGLEITANNSTATIIGADVKVADGFIHVIDAVLMP